MFSFFLIRAFSLENCSKHEGYHYIEVRAYRKAGYLTVVMAGNIQANSRLAAAIATKTNP